MWKVEYLKVTIQCSKTLIVFYLCFIDYTKQTGENEVQRVTVEVEALSQCSFFPIKLIKEIILSVSRQSLFNIGVII